MIKRNEKTLSELYKELGSSPNGLTSSEANKRILNLGLNTIGVKNHFVILKKVLDQFSDFLVIILLIAGLLSMILGDTRTAIAMFAIVGINAAIGFWQQYKMERTLDALKNLLPKRTNVFRSGEQKQILSRYVVPGDIVILQAGDSIPCDGKIIEYYSFRTNEASLTGESSPQLKHDHPDLRHPHADTVFMGTTVSEGEARVLAFATGLKTEFGKIALQTKQTRQDLSPLQKKLRGVGQTVAKISGSIMLAIIAYELIKIRLIDGKPIEASFFREIFLFALALAAALVPEGLPATVSVALSLGANRLIKKKAIVKKLSSVETLGSTNVICTDKTGTLTMGKMSVVQIQLPGKLEATKFQQFQLPKTSFLALNWALCGNAKETEDGVVGDADEVALLEALISKEEKPSEIIKKYKKIHEFSFNSIRKMMSVLVKGAGDEIILYSKGNPDIILSKCDLGDGQKKEILKSIDSMAEEGLRVLAFAHRDFNEIPSQLKPDLIENRMIFDGFCGIEDDIHPEVPAAIEYCHQAGIKIIMITGDYKITAASTARKINLSPDGDFRMVSGQELAEMKDLELRENLLYPIVFYETDPGEKLRIVETLQNMGLIVAVTGDGVNDALALKKADIGVAMGKSGTDVAKEAADMVLLDDNFATIVAAVREGRLIWDNLKKFLFYIFSSNAGEFMTVFFGTIFGLPLPILAVQVLSVDLGTDVFPSLALVADPAEQDILKKVVGHREELLGVSILVRLLYVGLIMGGGAAFNFWLISKGSNVGTDLYFEGTTAAFSTLVICQVVNVFEVRGGFSNFKSALFSNKYLFYSVVAELLILLAVVYYYPIQDLLSTRMLNLHQWIPILGIGFLFLCAEELRRAYTIKGGIVSKRTKKELKEVQ